MIYDYRIYEAPDSASMPVMLDVIEKFMATFAKHGMRVVGVWTPTISENNLAVHYLLEFRDLAHLEQAQAAYFADTTAQQEFVDSFGGRFTWLDTVRNYLLDPTDFSPPIAPSAQPEQVAP